MLRIWKFSRRNSYEKGGNPEEIETPLKLDRKEEFLLIEYPREQEYLTLFK